MVWYIFALREDFTAFAPFIQETIHSKFYDEAAEDNFDRLPVSGIPLVVDFGAGRVRTLQEPDSGRPDWRIYTGTGWQ